MNKPTQANPPPRRPEPGLCLRLSPLAWLKLQLFLHAGETEIGGFGVSSADDLLCVEDFVTVKQTASPASVEFDDAAVADYFDACVDAGLVPRRFARIWVHTHPGNSPQPSLTDEATFSRVFGNCDWSVMLVIARGGSTYARLSFSAGPGGSVLLPVMVDWASWPKLVADRRSELAGLLESWLAEYARNIQASSAWWEPMEAADARALDALWEDRLSGWEEMGAEEPADLAALLAEEVMP